MQHYSDIKIKVGGTTFHAHKNILAASSDYFKAMFLSRFKESTMCEIEVHLPQESHAFENLLEFIYTGKMRTVTPDTVCAVLDAACYLQVNQAAYACSALIRHWYNQKLMSHEHAEEISNRPEKELQDLVWESACYIHNVQKENQSTSKPKYGRMEPCGYVKEYRKASKVHFNTGEPCPK